MESDAIDDELLRELADILAGLVEQASAAGEILPGEVTRDELPFDLLKALAVESDPRVERMLDLMRERGWTHWIQPERLAEPGGSLSTS
jgi:hypothetical protein